MRLVVDAGLLLIVLTSLVGGQPFTLQYAREGAPREILDYARFLAVNRSITLVWAAAFAVLVLADAAMVYVPGIPRRLDIVATILALVGAYKYTVRATERASSSRRGRGRPMAGFTLSSRCAHLEFGGRPPMHPAQ